MNRHLSESPTQIGKGIPKQGSQLLVTYLCWETLPYSGTRKYRIVLHSPAETEIVSAASAGQEITWLIKLLTDLHLHQKRRVILYEDNQSCIKMIENEKFSKRTKDIDLIYHTIK